MGFKYIPVPEASLTKSAGPLVRWHWQSQLVVHRMSIMHCVLPSKSYTFVLFPTSSVRHQQQGQA